MPDYILAYQGRPNISSPEEGQAHMAAWRAWMQGLGTAVKEPGKPCGPSKMLGGGTPGLSGYTIVTAPDLEAAAAMAEGCPHLNGGSIEVCELLNMEM